MVRFIDSSEICVENRPILLSEQILYDFDQLKQHMDDGDRDENENLLIYHPYCEYCDQRLYNLEALKLHIKQQHYQCDICKAKQPYMVYQNYQMLKKHFETSHYPCKEPECLEMRVVVFASPQELEYHTSKMHRGAGGKGRFDAGTLLGVRVQEEDDDDGYLLKTQTASRGRGRGGGPGGRGGRGGVQPGNRAPETDRIGKDFTGVVRLA